MKYRLKKKTLSTSQRTTFERQLFALTLRDDAYRRIVEKAYRDFCFVFDETETAQSEFEKHYCDIILKNDIMLYDFSKIKKQLGMGSTSSVFYDYRNNVLEKIYQMCLKANLI